MYQIPKERTSFAPQAPPPCRPPRFYCCSTRSGLVHQLSEMVLAEMVLLCWARSSALRYIQALKFLELMGGNLLAITNVAICVNLALVVSVRYLVARSFFLMSVFLFLFALSC